MREIIPQALKKLASFCPEPLYVVGGSVRDRLAELSFTPTDWDICSPMSAEKFATIAQACGCIIQGVYRNTGTVKLRVGETECEYSCFRSDKYVRGNHVPV